MKRLKNIEGKNDDQLNKIEYQGIKQLDAIKKQGTENLISIKKQEKQLKEIKNQKKQMIEKINREEKSIKIILLRDNLDDILLNYGEFNISSDGENILKELADDGRNINYKNLFFKSDNTTIDNYDFFKRFGTLYDLLIDLPSKKVNIKKAGLEQNEMIDKIIELRNFVLLEEKTLIKKKVKVLSRK